MGLTPEVISIISMLLGALSFVLWYLLIGVKRENESLRKDFSELSLKVVSEFVHKTEWREFKAELKSDYAELDRKLDKIFDRLEQKVNKE